MLAVAYNSARRTSRPCMGRRVPLGSSASFQKDITVKEGIIGDAFRRKPALFRGFSRSSTAGESNKDELFQPVFFGLDCNPLIHLACSKCLASRQRHRQFCQILLDIRCGPSQTKVRCSHSDVSLANMPFLHENQPDGSSKIELLFYDCWRPPRTSSARPQVSLSILPSSNA